MLWYSPKSHHRVPCPALSTRPLVNSGCCIQGPQPSTSLIWTRKRHLSFSPSGFSSETNASERPFSNSPTPYSPCFLFFPLFFRWERERSQVNDNEQRAAEERRGWEEGEESESLCCWAADVYEKKSSPGTKGVASFVLWATWGLFLMARPPQASVTITTTFHQVPPPVWQHPTHTSHSGAHSLSLFPLNHSLSSQLGSKISEKVSEKFLCFVFVRLYTERLAALIDNFLGNHSSSCVDKETLLSLSIVRLFHKRTTS